jgi:hypothetical protein
MTASPSQSLTAAIGRLRRPSLVAGVVALAACAAGAVASSSPAAFFRGYLFAFVFFTGLSLGCLAIVMLHHLTGGAWGIPIRRILESGTRTLPLMAILFLPIALGMKHLYTWSRPEEVAKDALLQAKEAYLNVPFFLARSAFYFAVWIAIAYFVNRWSLEQDRASSPALSRKLQLLSAAGLVAYGLTMTFASIDWVMSLDPEWSSTMFGLLFVASWALSAMAFVIATMSLLSSRAPMAGIVRASHFHDLGKLLLALVMLWSYFAFSQFLIIWSGNLPEETAWYLRRLRGGWGWIAIAVVVLHFALPFLLLLSRDLKRDARKLAMLAGFLLLMRLVDLFWMIEPEFNRAHFHLSWLDVLAPLGIGGIWLAMFSWQLQQRPLVPLNDPQLESVLAEARKPVGAEAESY